MISVEQIRLLEERVLGVVSRLNELRNENRTLRESLTEYQDRIADLEGRVQTYTDSQTEIEQGILHALRQLDELEDEVTDVYEEPEPEAEAEAEIEIEDDEESEEGRTGPELDIF